MGERKLFGTIAEFDNPSELFKACEIVRDAGFSDWDSHSPFPVHGIEEAMGFSWSKVPWWALVFGLSGASFGFLLQWWVSAVASPLVISGKPMFSWPAFIPVTFELGILCTAIGTLLGMAVLNKLPMLWHPLLNNERFLKFSDDGFFISIESSDPKWSEEGTLVFLQDIGASHVELVEV